MKSKIKDGVLRMDVVDRCNEKSGSWKDGQGFNSEIGRRIPDHKSVLRQKCGHNHFETLLAERSPGPFITGAEKR